MKTELPRMLVSDSRVNADEGTVHWSPTKSLWLLAHYAVALIGGALTISPDSIAIFLCTTAVTLCLGHSLGMHRKLIHNSYACAAWLEYVFVYCGVLVGLAGPLGMVQTHDLRDWAQRQRTCHPYLRHGLGPWKDAWWQLHCDLRLKHAPDFTPEPRIIDDRLFVLMERTWLLQQLPLAMVLFALGGIAWVVWGISVRVAVSITGHWFIGYLAHNKGEMDHGVEGAAVQGHNVKWASYLTMGESWHNNHHAYPGSAVLGIYDDQPDPGWWVLNALSNMGLVWNLVLPSDLPVRSAVHNLSARSIAGATTRGPRPCPIFRVGRR